MQRVAVRGELLVQAEGASPCERRNQERVFGIGPRKIQIHDGTLVMGAERRDEHHGVAHRRVQIEGKCLPEIARGLDGEDHLVRIARREMFCYVLPEQQLKPLDADRKGERRSELYAALIHESSLVFLLRRVDTDDDFPFDKGSSLAQLFLIHR